MNPGSQANAYHGTGFAGGGPGEVRDSTGRAIPPRNGLKNHSPDGFQIGYLGSGPAQLALALLCERTDEGAALAHYQPFKREVIAHLDGDEWVLPAVLIDCWLDRRAGGDTPAGQEGDRQ